MAHTVFYDNSIGQFGDEGDIFLRDQDGSVSQDTQEIPSTGYTRLWGSNSGANVVSAYDWKLEVYYTAGGEVRLYNSIFSGTLLATAAGSPFVFRGEGGEGSAYAIKGNGVAGYNIDISRVVYTIYNQMVLTPASTGSSSIKIDWTEAEIPDGAVLSYTVIRDGVPIFTTDGPEQLSYTDSGLSLGEYSYIIRANLTDFESNPTTRFSNTITPSTSGLNLTTEQQEGGAYLTWDTSTLEDLLGYKIYKDGVLFDTVDPGINNYLDVDAVIPNCYDYKVIAFGTPTSSETLSDEKVVGGPYTGAVSDLSVDVDLSLQAYGDGFVSFDISGYGCGSCDGDSIRFTTGNEDFDIYITGNGHFETTIPAGQFLAANFESTVGANAILENFSVKFYAAEGQVQESNVSNLCMVEAGLSLIVETEDHKNKLTWSPSSLDGLNGYNIFRDGEQINSVDSGTTNYIDESAIQGQCYDYKVVAFSDTETQESNVVNFCTESDTEGPEPFAAVVTNVTDHAISISWDPAVDGGSGILNYHVFLVGQDDNQVFPSDPLTFTFTGLDPDTEYQINVIAVDNFGNETYANGSIPSLTATTDPLDTDAPSPPTLDEAANITHNSADLTWHDAVDNEGVTGYRIYVNGSFFTEVGNTETFGLTGLTPETAYEVYVTALDANGNESVPSNTINFNTEAAPICQVPIDEEALIPLRIYDDVKKQNRYKKQCRGIQVYELITPNNKILPFFIKRIDDHKFPTEINIRDLDGNLVLDALSGLTFEMLTDGTYAYLFYYGTIITGFSDLACGFYYLEIVFCETEKYYSEVFTKKPFTTDDELQPYVLLEWKHSKNITDLVYQTGYVNRLYIDSFLCAPDYALEEEGDENGDKEFIPTFQRGIKKYKIEITPVPEYIADTLFLLNAHDNKKLIGDNYIITNFQDAVFETKWVDTDCLATGIISFRKYNIIKSKTCGDNLDLEAVTSPIDCGQFKGDTLGELVSSGVTLGQIKNCLLSDFLP